MFSQNLARRCDGFFELGGFHLVGFGHHGLECHGGDIQQGHDFFVNSFGAVATAMALTGSSLSLVPIILFAQIRGDVLQDPHLGYAIAFGMIVITGIANIVYIVLRSRAERWLK